MQSTRRMRLESVIQQELSVVVSRELKDPRVPAVTFTSVELTEDGSQATVFVTLLGGFIKEDNEDSKNKIKDCIKGLTSASGFLRKHLARVLTVKHIPNLIFKEDKGLENVIRVQELLKKISESSS